MGGGIKHRAMKVFKDNYIISIIQLHEKSYFLIFLHKFDQSNYHNLNLIF